MSEEWMARIVLLASMGVAGGGLIWMAIAAASGRLRRNSLAGIRTARTLRSDEAWLAAHRRALRPTVAAGGAAVASGVLAIVPVSIGVVIAGVLVASAVMLVLVIYGAVVGGRAAEAV